ncbi:SIR2 family protein [Enterococcus faecium]|uniref:SIR2 family protein n=1 Tax=Enterococcus faecium TaxID=1352 RepID=UPI000CF1E1D1|nr:SIR2 family protein [Enterococcus faecium]PQG42022.1 SIR2 family protein [Enterococcus faecium]
MKIDSFIKQYSNHPVLFIGAGFSLRYLENSFTWEDLLKHVSLELTGNKEVYLDFKSESIGSDGSCSYEEIAGKLENLFNETLSQDRNGKFKEINDIFYYNMEKGIKLSRFKIYIAQLLNGKKLKENTENEIAALKRVRKNIGSVITTNYDNLIESLFDFNPLIGNDILLSNPYGAVYKIHGCVTNPEKIIITDNDYALFEEKYELIRAQLLSLFIHNPIIFIGYSIGDENIKKLLKTVFTYVEANTEIAEKIKSNFLVVEYEKDSNNLEVHDHDIVLEDLITIRINKIKTDNFEDIYNSLASIELPVSAMDIRKVQNVVKEIYEGGNVSVNIVDDLNDLKNNEKVLAIGNVNRISYDYQSIGELIANYFKIIEEDNFQILKVIDKQNINKGQFFPVFAFSEINTDIKKAGELKVQQEKKLKEIYRT